MDTNLAQSYQQSSLGIILDSQILSLEDFQKVEDMKEELVHNFLHNQIFRTHTEMVMSVLDDVHFPTPDAKYWQAMREQNVHYDQLVLLSYEYRKNLVEIKILKRDLEKQPDELEKELLRIEIEKREYKSKSHELIAKDRIREIAEWSKIKAELLPKLKYSPDDVSQHQLESYNARYKLEAQFVDTAGTAPERINLGGLLMTSDRLMEERK